MSVERCPNPDPRCPWFRRPTPKSLRDSQEHGCFSDLDHKVPQRLAREVGATALEKAYILNSKDNRQQLCRWEHDEKCVTGDDPIPSEEYMYETLARELVEGIVNLSESKRKQIGI